MLGKIDMINNKRKVLSEVCSIEKFEQRVKWQRQTGEGSAL